MHWTHYLSTIHGAAVPAIPLDNNLEANIAYSAFHESGIEGADGVSFAEFLSQYREILSGQEE